MTTVTVKFSGHEQANAFMLWITEDGGLEQFESSKWAKIANMFNISIKEVDEDARVIIID